MSLHNWTLNRYLPDKAHAYCYNLWQTYGFQLKITRPRKSKLGDYRFRASKKSHLITINSDLNPYAFLVVYLHEVAHCITTVKHGSGTKPHGPLWQKEMVLLLAPLVATDIFPRDLDLALQSYINAPKATSCAHPELNRVLRKYDPPTSEVALEQLSERSLFTYRSRTYRKMQLRRTRVTCLELATRRIYLIPKLAMVMPA